MEYFAILIIIAIFSLGMIASYIPYSLQNIAEKAGFGKFSLKYLGLKIKGIPIRNILLKYNELMICGCDADFDRFLDYYKKNPSSSDSIIKVLQNSKNQNDKLDFSLIIDLNLKENQLMRFLEIDRILKKNTFILPKEEILCLLDSKIDIKKVLDSMKRIKKLNLNIVLKTVINSNIDTFEHFLNLYEKVLEYKSFSENDWLNNTETSLDNKIKVLEGYIKLVVVGTTTDINDLIELTGHASDIDHYVNSLILIQNNKIDDIKPENLSNHLIKGGNPETVVNAFIKLKNSGIHIQKDKLFESEINNADFCDFVDQILYPFDIKVTPEIKVILADGLQITPEILVSVKRNPEKILFQPDFISLFADINHLAYERIQAYKTYQEVLNNLNTVSQLLYSDILNTISSGHEYTLRFEAVRISDIEIIADKLISVKKLESLEKENEIKLKILEEKKKFQENIEKALKNGEINYTDYQKEKYIFNSNDDTDLPYHTS